MADYKELLSLAAIGKGVGKNKYQDMLVGAVGGIGKPSTGNPSQPLAWDDPYYDAVITHLGYDVNDKQTRFKVIDYLAKGKMLPGDLIAQTSFDGRTPNPKKINNVRTVIDNYQAFTPDTAM